MTFLFLFSFYAQNQILILLVNIGFIAVSCVFWPLFNMCVCVCPY